MQLQNSGHLKQKERGESWSSPGGEQGDCVIPGAASLPRAAEQQDDATSQRKRVSSGHPRGKNSDGTTPAAWSQGRRGESRSSSGEKRGAPSLERGQHGPADPKRSTPLNRVDTHLLRSGGACALKLSGRDDVEIERKWEDGHQCQRHSQSTFKSNCRRSCRECRQA